MIATLKIISCTILVIPWWKWSLKRGRHISISPCIHDYGSVFNFNLNDWQQDVHHLILWTLYTKYKGRVCTFEILYFIFFTNIITTMFVIIHFWLKFGRNSSKTPCTMYMLILAMWESVFLINQTLCPYLWLSYALSAPPAPLWSLFVFSVNYLREMQNLKKWPYAAHRAKVRYANSH